MGNDDLVIQILTTCDVCNANFFVKADCISFTQAVLMVMELYEIRRDNLLNANDVLDEFKDEIRQALITEIKVLRLDN